jgi:resuscitation-promoting factor RpfC
MSRCPGRHAKTTSRYEGRHAKPGAPIPAAAIGTAAKVVPASLAAGAAGSALVLSGTAFAATTTPASPVHGGAADLASVKATATGTWVTQGRHAAPRSVYTVASGDTLSDVSARFCGTAADYQAIAAASGITNPDLIYPGQTLKLACHAASNSGGDAAPAASGSSQAPPQQPQAPSGTFSTGGMSAFESCVIAHESGGNAQAVNAVSGAGGLFQFLPSTWAALGYASAYPGGAQTAPASVQEAAFEKLYAEAGTSPWAPYDGC